MSWLSMGGYEVYVWSVVVLIILTVGLLAIIPMKIHKSLVQRIKHDR